MYETDMIQWNVQEFFRPFIIIIIINFVSAAVYLPDAKRNTFSTRENIALITQE